MELGNIKQAPLEMAFLLANNHQLQKLLIIDNNSLNDRTFVDKTPNELLKEEYISLVPVLENGIIKNDRNTFLVIQLNLIDMDNIEDITVSGEILIGCDYAHIALTDNRNRCLEIADEVIKTLSNAKISAAGTININNIESIHFSDHCYGYRVEFNFHEQFNRKAEI